MAEFRGTSGPSGKEPPPDSGGAPSPGTLRSPVDGSVDQVCREFERAWAEGGDRPQLSEYLLKSAPQNAAELRTRLLEIDRTWRQKTAADVTESDDRK